MNPDSDYAKAVTREEALEVLRWHWGGAYSIQYESGQFVATRRDNGATVRRPKAEELDAEIIIDYRAMPVPREP